MKRMTAGLSLVEMLIVVSIIAILSSVLFISFNEGSAQSRDAQRKADLRELQTALELYKNEHGRYPVGCNGPVVTYTNAVSGWSGELGTAHACADGRSDYIRGHASGITFAPGFISSLPTDPRPGSGDYGFVYAANADGTVYKIMVRNAVETETVTYASEFSSCDSNNAGSGMCDAVNSNSNNRPTHCQESNAQFQTSYALWGGYANVSPLVSSGDTLIERRTEDIICRR